MRSHFSCICFNNNHPSVIVSVYPTGRCQFGYTFPSHIIPVVSFSRRYLPPENTVFLYRKRVTGISLMLSTKCCCWSSNQFTQSMTYHQNNPPTDAPTSRVSKHFRQLIRQARIFQCAQQNQPDLNSDTQHSFRSVQSVLSAGELNVRASSPGKLIRLTRDARLH